MGVWESNENISALVVTDARPCKYTKDHWVVQFQSEFYNILFIPQKIKSKNKKNL